MLLVLIGLIGLVLGRLGETTWAPAAETTATVELDDPGPAVVIDPGVLYVGGMEGEVTIEGASDVSLITADNSDIEAYLEDARYTRITGASDWTTLSTKEIHPDGATELNDPTGSDLWRTVETKPSPYTFDIEDFAAGETGENKQVYRALLIVTDGTEPGAESVSITWPVDDENAWVPYAYAGGAAIAVIGLVLLVVSIGGRRRDEGEEGELLETEDEDVAAEDAAAGQVAAGEVEGEASSAAVADPSDLDEDAAGPGEVDPVSDDEGTAVAADSADVAETADDADADDDAGAADEHLDEPETEILAPAAEDDTETLDAIEDEPTGAGVTAEEAENPDDETRSVEDSATAQDPEDGETPTDGSGPHREEGR